MVLGQSVEETGMKDALGKVKVKVAQSCLTLCDPWTTQSINSPGQNTGVGSRYLLQRIFATQGSNPGLLRCMQIPYQLSHQGSPKDMG